MSISDIWGDVKCPCCGKKKLHVFFFDVDCRGNDSSAGGKCDGCGYIPTDDEVRDGLAKLRKKRDRR